MSEVSQKIAIRWTLGDVSDRGFESLRLSIWGAWNIFGDSARYAVCVNTIPQSFAQQKTGHLPAKISWHDVTSQMPPMLADLFDHNMAEGVGWKLAPPRLFSDAYEISLDNDCILWDLPASVRQWLSNPMRCLLAEDVKACFGRFADLCGQEPRNAGIRGFPPGFDLEAALRTAISRRPGHDGKPLTSETDEQGLQTAALSLNAPPVVVALDEVTICSPFYPHLPHLGRCGAHFVGLNARHIPWRYYDREADDCMRDHWERHRNSLYAKVHAPHAAAPPPAAMPAWFDEPGSIPCARL